MCQNATPTLPNEVVGPENGLPTSALIRFQLRMQVGLHLGRQKTQLLLWPISLVSPSSVPGARPSQLPSRKPSHPSGCQLGQNNDTIEGNKRPLFSPSTSTKPGQRAIVGRRMSQLARVRCGGARPSIIMAVPVWSGAQAQFPTRPWKALNSHLELGEAGQRPHAGGRLFQVPLLV